MRTNGQVPSQLCQANALRKAGDEETARASYLALWQHAVDSGDGYHACVAAHMLGVSEPMPLAEKRRWHLDSLARAQRVGDGRAAPFFASIYSNLGYVAMREGRREEAIGYYRLARRHAAALGDDNYGQGLRAQIVRALSEMTEDASVPDGS